MKDYEWMITILVITVILVLLFYISYRIDMNQYLINCKERMNNNINEWIFSRYIENGVIKTTQYSSNSSMCKYLQKFQ